MVDSSKAIPFVTVSFDADKQTTEFSISPEAMTFLSSLGHHELETLNEVKKIAVLCIGGPVNTGKSYLANQFVGKPAFKVRDAMPDSQGTQGIWLWKDLVQISEECNAIVLDCQGINDESYPEIDLKLMALSMLLSSQYVFNTVGLISDESLNQLSIM
jgi:guanylate-binding protein 6